MVRSAEVNRVKHSLALGWQDHSHKADPRASQPVGQEQSLDQQRNEGAQQDCNIAGVSRLPPVSQLEPILRGPA